MRGGRSGGKEWREARGSLPRGSSAREEVRYEEMIAFLCETQRAACAAMGRSWQDFVVAGKGVGMRLVVCAWFGASAEIVFG